MTKIKKMHFFVTILYLSFLLAGCIGQKTPEEKMFEIMEDVVEAEKSFEDQQDPLLDLEKKEKDLYEKIIVLGSKEHEEIVKLLDEALKVVSKRNKHINEEQRSLEASKEKFETISPVIKELDDKELTKKGDELYKIMIERYEIHDELYELYLKGINYDTELYNMLKNKEVSLEQLDNQITKINETYDKVLQANEQFNEKTKKYNETKMAFYKKAGFNVDE